MDKETVSKYYCHCGSLLCFARHPLKINNRFFMGWLVKPVILCVLKRRYAPFKDRL